MEPNYPNYTADELLRALSSINRDKFPQRVVLLQQELTQRGITYEEQQLPSGERQMVNVRNPQEDVDKHINNVDESAGNPRNDALSGIAVIIGLGFTFVVSLVKFSLSEQMFNLSFPIILLLAMPLFYVCWRQWKKAQLDQNSWFWAEITTPYKFMTNAMLLSLVGGFTMFHLGVLAFHHKTSQPLVQMAEIVSVHNKPRTRKHGPCSYSMEAKLPGYGRFEWCNQPQTLLKQIEVGDPIELQGKVSAAGFYVDKFQLKPSHSVN